MLVKKSCSETTALPKSSPSKKRCNSVICGYAQYNNQKMLHCQRSKEKNLTGILHGNGTGHSIWSLGCSIILDFSSRQKGSEAFYKAAQPAI